MYSLNSKFIIQVHENKVLLVVILHCSCNNVNNIREIESTSEIDKNILGMDKSIITSWLTPLL